MKTVYQSPVLCILKMHASDSLLMSTSDSTVSGGNGGWVKEDRSAASHSDYNVWDDDWNR